MQPEAGRWRRATPATERLTVYSQCIDELEEELCRVHNQVNVYKRRVHDLHEQNAAEAKKAEQWQLKYKNLHDQHLILVKEKEHWLSEREALQKTNDEIRWRRDQHQVEELQAQVEELQKAVQGQDSKTEDALSFLLKKTLEGHLEKQNKTFQKEKKVLDDLGCKADGPRILIVSPSPWNQGWQHLQSKSMTMGGSCRSG